MEHDAARRHRLHFFRPEHFARAAPPRALDDGDPAIHRVIVRAARVVVAKDIARDVEAGLVRQSEHGAAIRCDRVVRRHDEISPVQQRRSRRLRRLLSLRCGCLSVADRETGEHEHGKRARGHRKTGKPHRSPPVEGESSAARASGASGARSCRRSLCGRRRWDGGYRRGPSRRCR